tara:strand:+ start:967 stop:1701 length:735 start_codon:yes stop_codon:yes gene_type:complete
MKLNREQITELFGSAPEDQDGKKLVGCTVRKTKAGDWYLNLASKSPEWRLTHNDTMSLYHYPVAIFEDTHRQDGTPLDIDPLPEVAGYRVEYKPNYKPSHGEDIMMFTESRKWGLKHTVDLSSYMYNGYKHICLLHKVIEPIEHFDGVTHEIIHQPTTLADLVGEEGQKNFYLISNIDTNVTWPTQSLARYEEHGSVNVMVECRRPFDVISALRFVPIDYASQLGYRWSHSPFTTYEDANQFHV